MNRIREDNPEAAHSMAQAILHRVAEFRLFRPRQTWGRKGTRELVSPPYVIVYRLHEDVAEILRIWHGAQDWR